MKPLLRSSVCIGALIRETCLVLVMIKISQFELMRSAPITKLEPLPVETHQLQGEFASKPSSSYHQLNSFMQVHKLSSTSNNITCNDGSSVGYYMRLNNHSKSWIIYLQGGGFCWSEESCQQRWQRNRNLMSSHSWPKTKTGKLLERYTFLRCEMAKIELSARLADRTAPFSHNLLICKSKIFNLSLNGNTAL